jgi:NADPH:quinone reductase-like Zn-dependent oxidoreductase
VEKRFPMEQTADAHALMATNDTVGKILLTR